MTSDELIQSIRQYCSQNANEANVKKYSNYFKHEYIAYGLTQPQMNLFSKNFAKQNPITLNLIFEAIPELFASGKFEETTISLLLINELHKQFISSDWERIGKLFSIGISNWAHADTLGMFILPKFILKKHVDYNAFTPWLSSPYTFQRRSVAVTLIKVLKNDKSANFRLYFEFTETLMTDPEREVHQGMGWFLREAWKIQPKTTETFLLKWKDTCPRLIIQYATEKMDKANKERFKRLK